MNIKNIIDIDDSFYNYVKKIKCDFMYLMELKMGIMIIKMMYQIIL